MDTKPLPESEMLADDTIPPRATPPLSVSAETLSPHAGPVTGEIPAARIAPGYEILGELGRGGMGVVYKARHVALDRVVALKVILSGALAGAEALARFRTEATSLARLQRPDVVGVFEVGEVEGRPFLALEFVEGGSLADRLSRGPMPPADAVLLVARLARAVEAAHAVGVVHRDLKPANVLLAGDGTPKVTDFGLAKKLDEQGQTHSGALLGTPDYMAPEQARSDKYVGKPADVWALGAILYECLTGRPPFRGEGLQATLNRITNDSPPAPRSLAAGLGSEVEAVCLRCLEKATTDRYPSAAELADDLDRLGRSEPCRLPRSRRWKPAVGRRTAFASCSLALAASVLVALAFWGRRPKDAVAEAAPFDLVRQRQVEREVASWRRQPPATRTSSPVPVRQVERLTTPDNSAFEILEDSRVWDLRSWRPIAEGGAADAVAPVSMTVRMRLKKLGPTGSFVLQARTSGKDVFVECLSHPKAYRVDAQSRPDFVGKQRMKTRHCVVDVSDVPEQAEFDLRFRSTYLTSFQSPDDRWVGVIGYEHAFKVSQLILFPDDLPPVGEPALRVAPTVRGTAVAFEGEKRTLSDAERTYFFWEVLNPRQGQVYQLHWAW